MKKKPSIDLSKIASQLKIKCKSGVCPVATETVLLAQTASHFPIGRVLDMGTGTGYIGIYLSKVGFDVDAVDISTKAIINAQENAKSNDVNLNIFRSSLFKEVKCKYDIITFNVPRNPNEGPVSRLIAGFIRRFNFFIRIFVPIAQKLFGEQRFNFITNFINQAQNYLTINGHIVMHLTREEFDKLKKQYKEFEFNEQHLTTLSENEVIVSIRRLDSKIN